MGMFPDHFGEYWNGQYETKELSNYLIHLPSYDDFIFDIYVEEELNERWNGGYLDDDSNNAREFDNTRREVKLERSRVLIGDYGTEKDDEGGMKYVLIHVGDTMDPYDVKVPKTPDIWVDRYTSTEKGGLQLKNWTT